MMLAFFLVINSQSIDTFAGMVGSLEDRLWHAVCVCVCVHAYFCRRICTCVIMHVETRSLHQMPFLRDPTPCFLSQVF